MRTIRWLCVLTLFIAAAGYFYFGTLSPCAMLREEVRQRDGLAAILPDSIVDMDIAAQYGALSPGRCFSLLLGQKQVSLSTSPRPVLQQKSPLASASQSAPQTLPRSTSTNQDTLSVTLKEAQRAIDECRAKRLSKELVTFAASVQCSNPRLIQSFRAVHYRYMDLIEFLAMKRLEVAEKIDRKELTEDQAQLEYAKLMNEIAAAERQRDSSTR
jgi:hypothetical protein